VLACVAPCAPLTAEVVILFVVVVFAWFVETDQAAAAPCVVGIVANESCWMLDSRLAIKPTTLSLALCLLLVSSQPPELCPPSILPPLLPPPPGYGMPSKFVIILSRLARSSALTGGCLDSIFKAISPGSILSPGSIPTLPPPLLLKLLLLCIRSRYPWGPSAVLRRNVGVLGGCTPAPPPAPPAAM
jgi:hypothetical protein